MRTLNKLVLLAIAAISLTAHAADRPKLILTLVIDQFRADYLMRFQDRFMPPAAKNGEVGGFRYLMEKGAYFPYAEYGLLQCMTGPGHATILSGSFAYQNGIAINNWFDRQSGKNQYCVADANVEYVSDEPVKSKYPGSHSPHNFIGTTVGDELKNAGLPSRVISIAIKDRAAVLMGGKRPDLALWHDSSVNQWVSSTYYLPSKKLPAWVSTLNKELKWRSPEKATLKAEGAGTGYSEDSGELPLEAKSGGPDSLALPYGLEITETAAEHAVGELKLGSGKATDLLAVSFSSHDYLGHAYGPNSRDMEEMTVAEDRLISKLLNKVRKTVPGGLSSVAIVLTADHGIAPTPDYAEKHNLGGGHVSEADLSKTIDEKLRDKFGAPAGGGTWVPFVVDFNFYLSPKGLAARPEDEAKIEALVKDILLAQPSAAQVFTRAEYRAHLFPPGLHGKQTVNGYFDGRSGDVVMIPKPFFMPGSSPGVKEGTTHLTGYAYDRTVPLIFAGYHIRPGKYANTVQVVDIAPTLTFLSQVMPPALSEGRVLNEIITTTTAK